MDISFLSENNENVAKKILGKALRIIEKRPGYTKVLDFIITETEYYSEEDEASHTYLGKRTSRNKAMYLPYGHLYVYMIYGIYYCLNIVTGPADTGAAVLIRGGVPVNFMEEIQDRRNCKDLSAKICNGPGKLCQGLGVDKSWDALDLTANRSVRLEDLGVEYKDILIGTRVGIQKAKEKAWRFMIPTFTLQHKPYAYESTQKMLSL